MEFHKAVENLSAKTKMVEAAIKESDIAAGIVGDALRHKRESKKISLRDCAKQIGISPAYLSDIERGNRWPRPIIVEKILKVLDAKKQITK